MVSVSVRELTHNFSDYLKKVKKGERIIIKMRNVPVAEITPYNENVSKPGWKRDIKRISIKGVSFSDAVIKNREEE